MEQFLFFKKKLPSMMSETKLYLDCHRILEKDNTFLVTATVETYLAYFVSKYCEYPSKYITFVQGDLNCNDNNNSVQWIISESSNNCSIVLENNIDDKLKYCIMPFITNRNTSYIRSGVCCVLRSIILIMQEPHLVDLLGPSRCCLKACAEVSQWTYLCENYIPSCLKNISNKNIVLELFAKIETILSQPSKIHNVKKIQKYLKANNIHLKNVNLEGYHPYLEGINMTLTDIVIYSTLILIIQKDVLYKDEILLNFPKLAAYFSNLHKNQKLNKVTSSIFTEYLNFPSIPIELLKTNQSHNYANAKEIKCVSPLSLSLNTILTRFEEFSSNGLGEIHNNYEGNWMDLLISSCEFDKIKEMMPKSRFDRKCDQLRNMVKPIIYYSHKIKSVVDFCAGSGQLGYLISYLLPNHNVILVENKEESIMKAKEKVFEKQNIIIYQTNLDYFHQPFDLGVCLHGCGFVSDLVLQKCIEKRSIFVICPCCYGSIKETSNIIYPQSKILQQIFSYSDFTLIAHTADQTQNCITNEETGKTCMSIVDLDRSLKAQENNYKTVVYKMQPASCSPKNNMIVGIPLEMLD